MHPDFLFQLYHLPQKGISEEAGLEGDDSMLSPKLIHSTHLEILQATEYSLATRVTLHEMYKHLFFQ